MPATLVRGTDEHGHFDMQPSPEVDFGSNETELHDDSFQRYLKNFFEQLELHEATFPHV